MRGFSVVLALAAGLGLAGAAAAQEPEGDLRDEVSAIADQLQGKLRVLAEALNVPFPDVRAQMDPLIRAAVPIPPEEGDWGFNMAFDSKISVTDSGRAPTEGRQSVFNDAQACMARHPEDGPVVHFRRIRQDDLRGHQCVLAGIEGDEATFRSYAYVEGPDRHLISTYSADAQVDDDPAGVLALVDPVVETNIALASAIVDLGMKGLPLARVRDDD